MSKDSCAEYCQENDIKGQVNDIKTYPKKKKKSSNIVMNDVKISLKMKGWLSTEKL